MHFFKLYGQLAVLTSLLFCVAFVLIAFIIHYSVRRYEKPEAEHAHEHAEPGIPLVLKVLYFGVAFYILVATVLVAVRGVPI